jgi:hypothetical protein
MDAAHRVMPTIVPVRETPIAAAEMSRMRTGMAALPPAPRHAGAGMRWFNRLYAWGVGIAVAAIIVPQYLYLFTCYLDGPLPLIAHDGIAPLFAAGSGVALGVVIATPVRLFTHFRTRRDRRAHGRIGI